MIKLADRFQLCALPQKNTLMLEILELALKYADFDVDGRAPSRIQARVGRAAYLEGKIDEAKRHLFSAVFGAPKDPWINLWLAELYEETGKSSRAWTRYMAPLTLVLDTQASSGSTSAKGIDGKVLKTSLSGLDRLHNDPAFRHDFTMIEAAQMLEGRISEFHPISRYVEDKAKFPGKPKLIEMFACGWSASTHVPQISFEALGDYFEDTDVVLLEYHIDEPINNELACDASNNRAQFYKKTKTPCIIFDGTKVDRNGSKNLEKAEEFFEKYKEIALSKTKSENLWALDSDLSIETGKIEGAVKLSGGKAGENLRLNILLVERVVISGQFAQETFPLFLHRNVVRYAISPPKGFLVAQTDKDRTYKISIDPAEVSAKLAARLTEREKTMRAPYLMHPTYVDPRTMSIIAVLQDSETHEVLAAKRFDLWNPEDEE